MSCAKKFSVGETGTVQVVNAGLVLTSATDIEYVITKPNGVDMVSKTLLGGEISIGTVDYDDIDDDGNIIETFTAFEYINYPIESGLLDIHGDWKGVLLYQIPGDSPPVNAPGCCFTFEVIKACF